MTIHSIFRVVSPYFRRKRFERFRKEIEPSQEFTILDVGGTSVTWTDEPPCAKQVELINLSLGSFDKQKHPEHSLSFAVGDATDLQYADGEFDIVFSNSVIEHLYTFEAQKLFAREVRRVGGKLWIQTPAREFFMEPHFIAPFVHWLPKKARPFVVRWLTPMGLLTRITREKSKEIVDEIRLLNHSELSSLFPDCEIIRERFLGVFTKSYIAVRK